MVNTPLVLSGCIVTQKQEHPLPTTIRDTNLCARNLANKQERSRCIGIERDTQLLQKLNTN